jgi:hypothetical protein
MKSRNALLGAFLIACRGDPAAADASSGSSWLVLSAASDAVELGTLRVEPPEVVESTSRQGSKIVLALRSGRGVREIRVDADRACGLVLPVAELMPGAVIERALEPWLDFGGPHVGVGFDTPLTIEVTPGCPDAEAGSIEWQRADGATGATLESEAGGFRLRLRTPAAQQVLGAGLPWGIVPISPRTRGAIVLDAEWRGKRPTGGMRSQRFQLEITAAHRSRGLPNVALGTSLLLSREGWRVVDAPVNAKAAPRSAGGFSVFEPDRHGRWVLEDAQQQKLSLHAARYDQTPLDCGRADCHASITQAATKSPMTSILRREIERAHPDYPSCALACHTTGEPGAQDGGFSHVAAEIGLYAARLEAEPGAWDELPRSLRRLGGVGCLACHGPGAIPEPSARAAVLRSDVCAYCHDAPPRYGHVEAWRTSAMARADRDPRASTEPRCVRCHTSEGFLAHQRAPVEARPEPEKMRRTGEPIGIACAACHAVHDPGSAPGTQPALLRSVRMPTLLADQPVDPKSRVCTPCHTPSVDETAPSASAAALMAGRGGLDPASGDPIEGPAPHARAEGGCLACHSAGPSALERGAGHAFVAHRDACRRCHASLDGASPNALRARAERLWTKLESRLPRPPALPQSPLKPPHAAPLQLNPKTPLGRAARNVLLVIEDPAAAEHNLPYARKLLDASERWIETR